MNKFQMMNTNKEFQIRRLGPDSVGEAKQLFFVLSGIFGDKPANASEGHVEKLLHNPAVYILAALCDEEIVGGLTAYELPMYHADVAELYIYDIGVKAAFQRMGVASKMLDSLKANCGGKGIEVVFVDASEADGGALDFYRSTKASEEKVIQFTYELDYDRRSSA
jgi:aminoglycoside 3-N-acetyltransferase I